MDRKTDSLTDEPLDLSLILKPGSPQIITVDKSVRSSDIFIAVVLSECIFLLILITTNISVTQAKPDDCGFTPKIVLGGISNSFARYVSVCVSKKAQFKKNLFRRL